MPDTRTEPGADLDNETAPDTSLAESLGIEPGRRKKPRRLRPLWIGLAVLVLVALAAAWGLKGDGQTVSYKTQPVTRGDLKVTVTATGNLEPTNQVDVGSELSGIVETVDVDYNDVVQPGQVLARLDTSRLDAQLIQANAALQAAHAKVEQAQATLTQTTADLKRLDHVRELSGGQVPSQADMDAGLAAKERAAADLASARAQVAQAQGTVDGIQTDLGKTIIRSPIRGIVLKRSVEPGQTVAASLQAPVLFTLAEDLAHMELHVDVDEADVGRVAEGQKATFTVDAYPERTFPAKVTQVRYGSETVGGVVTYETVLEVDNADLSLRPGMTATADISVQSVTGALLVPNAALRFAPPAQPEAESGNRSLLSRMFPHPPRASRSGGNGRGPKVWVLKDGQPAVVRVTTGASDGSRTQVLTGDLKEGAEVITDSVTVGK
jgi:HlyD family secretion protein